MDLLKHYFTLPPIHKTVGWLDKYGKGHVAHIDFQGELTFVWIQYKHYRKAYRI